MSEWDVINTVVGSVLGCSVAGPIGGIIGAAAGVLLPERLAPQHLPQKGPPYEDPHLPAPNGTLPPLAPPLPPPPPPSGEGEAHDETTADAADIAASIEVLTQLDRKTAESVAAIEAAGAQGRQALDEIATSVDAKITELGPRLNTPQGQQELRDFLNDRLTNAKRILDEQNQISIDKAQEIHEIAERFRGLGLPRGDGEATGTDDSVGAASESGSAGATAPAAAPETAAAPSPPAATPPVGAGVPPGMGTMMPPFPMPAMGGGGLPAAGMGDPLSALTGLGARPADDGLPLDDPEPQTDPGTGDSAIEDESSHRKGGPAVIEDSPTEEQTEAGEDAGDTTPSATQGAAGDLGSVQADAAKTDVRLPDGTTVEAPTEQAATAARAALAGASVSEAYEQAGITLPPAGSPVLDPVAPGTLQAGDVGVWKDHMVMALGEAKVLVSGQVQPQSSVGSGPDFLGWMRPSDGKSPPPTSPTPSGEG